MFTNSKGYRNIAIYLTKKLTGMANRETRQLFGDLGYSAVAKAHQRLSTKVTKDKSLRKRVEGGTTIKLCYEALVALGNHVDG